MLDFLSQVAMYFTNIFVSIGNACNYIINSITWLTGVVSYIPSFIGSALLAVFGIFLLRFILLR